MSYSDGQPVGWTNPRTGARYARNVAFSCALDNYEPGPRRVVHSLLEEWRQPDGSATYVLVGWQDETDAVRAVYLLDDGRSVRPFHVAGYSQRASRIFLRPFPVNHTPDGAPVLRPDNGRPVDYGIWLLGPRRAYHLKLDDADGPDDDEGPGTDLEETFAPGCVYPDSVLGEG